MAGAARRQHHRPGVGDAVRLDRECDRPVRAHRICRPRTRLDCAGADSSKDEAMEPVHLAHLIVLGTWAGVVITEVLFEFSGSDPDSLRAAARFHYNVDKFGEIPV